MRPILRRPVILAVTAMAVAASTVLPARASGPVPTAAVVPQRASFAAVFADSSLATRAADRARLIADLSAQATAERTVARRFAQAAQRQAVRARIVQTAHRQVGDRYAAGRSGPTAFDCSGLVRYVYRVVAGKDLPHNSGAQYSRVKKISRAQALPGDLVFFLRGNAHHVGIYIGKGRMIDAAGYGKGVRISPISGSWWSRTYTGMGRVLPT